MNFQKSIKLICSMVIAIYIAAVVWLKYPTKDTLWMSTSNNFQASSSTPYKIGVGIADVTGSIAEMGMMGYAMLNQKTHGLHLRLRSRAFIFVDKKTDHTIVFVNVDICLMLPTLKKMVIDKLKVKYGERYTHDNVMISATHTHSGPGGYSQLVLYDITTLGYSERDQTIIVNGIYESIVNAIENMKDGRIKMSISSLDDANINRSEYSYEFNPTKEKEEFKYNTDHLFTLLRLEDAEGVPIGMLNWFSVHGTSMNNKNELVSGDNKGRAEQLFEKYMNSNSIDEDQISILKSKKNPFIAAFCQSNEGDVSPNTKGAFCPNGSPCDAATSLCTEGNGFCIATGPGDTDIESTDIIGKMQFEKAKELFEGPMAELSGSIKFLFKFQKMDGNIVNKEYTSTGADEKTCTAALGFSFAGGTTDGPGDMPFHQDDTTGNKFFDLMKNVLSRPTKEQIDCQRPKKILLNTGSPMFPVRDHAWTAHNLPLQIFQIGNLYIIGVPGEFTTMAGRRLRKSVYDALMTKNAVTDETVILIAGLTNSYSHYITTFEEYQAQRYEGGSTLFGPHTLAFYQQEFSRLAKALSTNNSTDIISDLEEDFTDMTLHVRPGVLVDSVPHFKKFGDVRIQPKTTYIPGDKVIVQFWGAHPNNNPGSEETYLTVERKEGSNWVVIADDSAWETILRWKRHELAKSIITIEWNIPPTMKAGIYRINHFGYHKNILQEINAYNVKVRPSW